MDPKVLKLIERSMPKFNERVTMGFHQREFQNVKPEYERRLRMTLSSLEKRGVWFFGV